MNFPLWTKCSTKVQAAFRGMVGRWDFEEIKKELMSLKEIREARLVVFQHWEKRDIEGEREQVIRAVDGLNPIYVTEDLLLYRTKCLYSLTAYGQCEASARELMGKDIVSKDNVSYAFCAHN